MKDSEKKEIDSNRKKMSLKNMYFNRYLLIRYLTAGFFFTNIYWLVLLWLSVSNMFWVPLILLVAILPAVAEQVKLYRYHKNVTPWTNKYYWFQIVINGLLLAAVYSPVYQSLFPFMNQGNQGHSFISMVLLAGLLLSLLIQYRLGKIRKNQDRHYDRIQQYEKVL